MMAGIAPSRQGRMLCRDGAAELMAAVRVAWVVRAAHTTPRLRAGLGSGRTRWWEGRSLRPHPAAVLPAWRPHTAAHNPPGPPPAPWTAGRPATPAGRHQWPGAAWPGGP